MDLSQLEQAYTELGRILLVTKMCQGEFLFYPNLAYYMLNPTFQHLR